MGYNGYGDSFLSFFSFERGLIKSFVQEYPTSLRKAVCKDAQQPFPPTRHTALHNRKGPRVQLHLYSIHHGCDSDAFVFAHALAKGYEHDERQSRGPYNVSRLAFARELMAKVTKAQGHNHLRFAMASFSHCSSKRRKTYLQVSAHCGASSASRSSFVLISDATCQCLR